MEREKKLPRPDPTGGGDAGDPGDGVEAIVAQEILAAADRILDSIRPINAELYLQQNQQSGGE
jgi:hypothetical protein